MFNYTIYILISAYVQSQSIFGGERSLAVVLRPVHRGVKMDLDEVDRKMILALIEEPKASLRTLASEVGIALGTAVSNGMLLRGFFDMHTYFTGTFNEGIPVYVDDNNSGYVTDGVYYYTLEVGHTNSDYPDESYFGAITIF